MTTYIRTSDRIKGLYSKDFLPSFLRPPLSAIIPRHDIIGGDQISTPSEDYWSMYEHWELPVHLMGGTLAMRSATTTYLPKEERETDAAYTNRLCRTILYGVYSRTIKVLSGLPFVRPIILEDIPEPLEYLEDLADNQNRSLTDFANDILQDIIHFGKSHILVDFPNTAGVQTLQDEQDRGVRPYFIQVSPLNLIGWETRIEGSSEVLTQIRIFEDFSVPDMDKDYGTKPVRRVRVYGEESIEIYEQSEGEVEYKLVDSMVNTLGYIPLVTVYGNRKGFMMSEPVLEELAWLNLRHYQKQSDLDHIEHFVNQPLLFGAGFDDGEITNIEIGPNRAIFANNVDAKLTYVEHTGTSIGAAQRSMEALEKRMTVMGADLLMKQTGGRVTATASILDNTESVSLLENIIISLEKGLEQAYAMAGDWLDIEADDVVVTIGDNLDLPLSANDFTSLLSLSSQGEITNEELLSELKRRGLLSDSFRGEPLPEEESSPEQEREANSVAEEDNPEDEITEEVDNANTSDG